MEPDDRYETAVPEPEASKPGLKKAWPLVKRFWPWVRPYWRSVALMTTCLILGTPLGLVSPLVVRRVVDDAVERSSYEDVLQWGGLLIGLTLVAVGLELVRGRAKILLDRRVLRDLQKDLYLHSQRLSLSYYQNRETGYLLSRQVDDVRNLSGVMADTFLAAGVDAFTALAYLAMLFVVEWRMALGGLALTAVILGFQALISPELRRRTKQEREAWTEVSQSLHQAISGQALVRAAAGERHEARRMVRVLHRHLRSALRRDLFTLWTNHTFALIASVAPALIVLAGVVLIVTRDFTVGGLFAFFMYLMSMFASVASVASLNPRLQSSLASLERIFEVLDTEPEVETPRPGRRLDGLSGRLELQGVDFGYLPGRPVLSGLDLTVEPRTMVAVVGASGAGKTTLASLVLRFYDPTAGRILVDGVDLRELDLSWYRRRVGLVPQDIFLFDRTVAENIAYGQPSATREAIAAAAEAARATEFIDQLPDGFETLVGERGVRLSGGQRQRLAIAREILRDPALLILDEATSALDAATEALVQEALDTLLAGRTSIVIAHRLSTVQRAARIVVLDGGRVVDSGTHLRLLDREGPYRALYRTQLSALE